MVYSLITCTSPVAKARGDRRNRIMTVELLAYTEFIDGKMRPVFEDARGQFVLDDNGDRIDGAWHIPREECPKLPPEPLIVPCRETE